MICLLFYQCFAPILSRKMEVQKNNLMYTSTNRVTANIIKHNNQEASKPCPVLKSTSNSIPLNTATSTVAATNNFSLLTQINTTSYNPIIINTMFKYLVDDGNNFWLVNQAQNLIKINKITGTFAPFDSSIIPDYPNNITGIARTSTDIWVATAASGLVRINIKNNNDFSYFNTSNSSLKNNNMVAIAAARDTIWLLLENHSNIACFEYDTNADQLASAPQQTNSFPNGRAITKNDAITVYSNMIMVQLAGENFFAKGQAHWTALDAYSLEGENDMSTNHGNGIG